MARETKLGLLVGLGFIICFAIILENRGRRERVTPQLPHELITQAAAPTEASPIAAADRVHQQGQRRPTTAQKADRRADRPVKASRQAGRNAGRGRGMARNQQPDDRSQTSVSRREPQGPAIAGQNDADPTSRFNSRRALAMGRDRDDAARRPEPQPAADALDASLSARVSQQPAAPAEAAPADQNPEPETAGRTYEVKKGDTLSGIAHRLYGSRSKRVIDAIFDTNRAELPSPNALRVGQVIRLPSVEGFSLNTSETAPARAETPANTRPERSEPKLDYVPYQVRKGDRLMTIARDQLGDAGRWKEIADMNRDIFPDPAKIRYGVRIRLPSDAKGAASGSRS